MTRVKVKFLVLLRGFYILIWILGNLISIVSESSHSVEASSSNSSSDNVSSVEQSKKIKANEERKFPDYFLLGVASSAFQIEGGWNVSDKSESNWEFMIHQWPETIKDTTNADIAANSYYMYKTDIGLIKRIGADAYRMSLSWSRILPTGFVNYINKDGIRYYNAVIDELLANGITPHVTISHWDLPQKLQELGGWTNPLIVDWFVDYARIVFSAFGDRVKLWSTINEPSVYCGYDWGGGHVPASHQSGIADYLCGHYSLLAHSKVYRMYNEKFRSTQKGQVGIVLSLQWAVEYGVTDETDGMESWFQWLNGWFLHPIFTDTGDYPMTIKKEIARNSRIQGFSRSRLPEFTPEEIKIVKYSSDFLGVNFYSNHVIEKWTDYDPEKTVSFYGDIGMRPFTGVKNSSDFDSDCTPWGFKRVIQRVRDNYNVSKFYITENGYPDQGGLSDVGRANYYRIHLTEVQKLMSQGINILGYFAWSLLDNFEWTRGFTSRFGLFSIDFTDPNRTRVPKLSSEVITDIYKQRKV